MSWYRFAPVETIQSMNPARMSGISVLIPSPAGVSAPEIETPTVQSGSSIFRVKTWQTSRSRPAL